MAACTTHFALAVLVSAAAHEAKSAAPEVARNAAFSTPSRGDGGRSGAELVACKRSCSPILAADDEGMFPFEKSKSGLGEALVAGLSASLQCTLAPLRHLWWDVAATWYCRESHMWRHRGLVRLQEACASGRWRGPISNGQSVAPAAVSQLSSETEPQTTPPRQRVAHSAAAALITDARCEKRAGARSVAPEPRERSSIASAAAPRRRRRADAAAPPSRSAQRRQGHRAAAARPHPLSPVPPHPRHRAASCRRCH